MTTKVTGHRISDPDNPMVWKVVENGQYIQAMQNASTVRGDKSPGALRAKDMIKRHIEIAKVDREKFIAEMNRIDEENARNDI